MNTQPLILDIGHIQRRIHAVQLDIARYGVTLRLADFATLLMLFVFLVGFYVADPFHIASFIAQRFGANGTVELAVYALLLGYGLLFPNQRVMLLFPPIPMKARTFVIVFGGLELLLGVYGGSGIAHFAHLGGMFGGFLMIRYWRGQPPFGRSRRR